MYLCLYSRWEFETVCVKSVSNGLVKTLNSSMISILFEFGVGQVVPR